MCIRCYCSHPPQCPSLHTPQHLCTRRRHLSGHGVCCATVPGKQKEQETLGSPAFSISAGAANAAGRTSVPHSAPPCTSMPRGPRAGAPEPSAARPTTLCRSRRPPADPPPPPLPHGPAQPDVRAGTFGAASGYCCCRRPPPPPPPPPPRLSPRRRRQ